MADSFGAATFVVIVGGQGHNVQADVVWTHIPGSNTNVADCMGRREDHYPYTIYLDNITAYNTLSALVGSSATLTTRADGARTAVLESLSRPERNWDGTIQATATFGV